MPTFKDHWVLLNKAALAGAINSLVGYAVIFALIFVGIEPIVSNVAGYSVGLVVSYFLNKYWVINNRKKDRSQIYKFILAFVISYSLSLLFLYFFIYSFGFDKYGSQFLSGGVYFLVFLIFNKMYVFRF